MNKHILSSSLAVLLISAGWLCSQPAPAKPAGGVDAGAALQQIKADNAEMLERQATTLKALEVLQEEARQVRIFSKRS